MVTMWNKLTPQIRQTMIYWDHIQLTIGSLCVRKATYCSKDWYMAKQGTDSLTVSSRAYTEMNAVRHTGCHSGHTKYSAPLLGLLLSLYVGYWRHLS